MVERHIKMCIEQNKEKKFTKLNIRCIYIPHTNNIFMSEVHQLALDFYVIINIGPDGKFESVKFPIFYFSIIVFRD